MFEGAQHQVGHKGRHYLQGQGVLAFAQWLFDFVDPFKPSPPFLYRPPLFIEQGD